MPLQKEKRQTAVCSSDRGYSLVEVLIAMAIFSIGILAVFAMMTGSINGNASARMQTEAYTLAADWIESLDALPYNHSDLDDGSHSPVNMGAFQIAWEVNSNFPITNTKAVTVTVTCSNPNARDVSIQFVKGRNI